MVGIFQSLRPDPSPLEPILQKTSGGLEVFRRLSEVYAVAGDARRPDGMKDAFFIVRQPPVSQPDSIRRSGEVFFSNLANLAFEQSKDELARLLTPVPTVRLLEGAAPKHPKAKNEQSELMKAVTQIGPTVTERLMDRSEIANFAQRAIYFVACDGFLRDYILWPLISEHSAVEDPFRPYFEIWKHGVKYRIFKNVQIDFYLPRVFTV